MNDKPYTVGVVGCGWVGTNRHIPSYERDDRAALLAVYDRDRHTAKRTATEHGVPRAHHSLDQFFDEPLDLVSICTPPWTHSRLTKRALEAGIHVLSEKPMAMSPAEANEMIRTAENANRSLGIVHNFLFSRAMREAKSLFRAGEVGEIRSVIGFQTSSARRHLPSWYPELPGGLFFDESPHLLYLMEHFLGELTVEQTAVTYDESAEQSLRRVDASVRGSDGKQGTLLMNFDAPLSEWHLVVIGSEKILVVDIFRDILIALDKERSHSALDVLGTSLSAIAQELRGILASGVRMGSGSLLFGMDELTSRYLDSLEYGHEPPITGADGARVVRNIDAILDESVPPE